MQEGENLLFEAITIWLELGWHLNFFALETQIRLLEA